MNIHPPSRNCGFTLIETVIAIGVLAVLLTGFMLVFGPATAGIRRALNVQEADRLAATLEQELVTVRDSSGSSTTGFAKAFEWIKNSNTPTDAILTYQYRGDPSRIRDDQTPTPVTDINNKLPGKDYVLQTAVRRKSDTAFEKDLKAVEGGVYLVICTQLVFNNGQLKPGKAGAIVDPKGTGRAAATADVYPEAVIAFSADFFALPTKSATYFTGGGFDKAFAAAIKTPPTRKPVFTRNLAARR